TFAMLSYTLPGMPLIYSGQEVGLNKRLEFFEKDKINWDYSSPLIKFYAELNNLKKENEALWNGNFGGSYIRINTSGDEKVYAFFREKNENKVLVVASLCNENINAIIEGTTHLGKYKEYFTGEELNFVENTGVGLRQWEFKVYVSE
ncbi:MAG: alpha-amylase, partial [Bacteroidales bacterium]|nr:alpha-amylase [Bacteroidales bacterium]